MSASPGKSFGLMLPRPSWVAAAAFSLAVHGGVAAMFLRGEPAAPVAGSAVPVEVVIVEGPDATTAAAPDADAAQAAPAEPVKDPKEAAPAPPAAAITEDSEAEAAPAPPAASEEATARTGARTAADAPLAIQSAPAADERAAAPPADAGAAAEAAGHQPPGPPAAAEQPRLRPEPRPQPAADRSPDGQGHAKQQLEAAAPSRGAAPLGGNPKPAYPRAARLRGDEGRVVLRVEVLASGEAGAVTVAASSGHASLDEAARDALRHWRFQPALSAGRPVRAVLEVPVRFRLDEGGGPASW